MQEAENTMQPVEGPSFPVTVKVMATLLVLALMVYGWRAASGSSEPPLKGLAPAEWGFLLAVCVVIASGYWGVLTSRTSCDGLHIEQTWLWRKKVNVADVTQVKLIHVPGLEWLVVPRLVVRTGFGMTTFHAGDAAVFSRFKLLAYGA